MYDEADTCTPMSDKYIQRPERTHVLLSEILGTLLERLELANKDKREYMDLALKYEQALDRTQSRLSDMNEHADRGLRSAMSVIRDEFRKVGR